VAGEGLSPLAVEQQGAAEQEVIHRTGPFVAAGRGAPLRGRKTNPLAIMVESLGLRKWRASRGPPARGEDGAHLERPGVEDAEIRARPFGEAASLILQPEEAGGLLGGGGG